MHPGRQNQQNINLIQEIISKKKTTVKALQKLFGFLNFLCRCIVPGRAFTRRIYSYFSSNMLPHHHLRVNSEIKQDLEVWLRFLSNPVVYCHPFLDYSQVLNADVIDWYTDASGVIGFGGNCGSQWFKGIWEKEFLTIHKPSIEFLELYAVTVMISLWSGLFTNKRICLSCDNQAVVQMLNSSSSSCKNCMKLIRSITLICLERNVRIFARFVPTKSNYFADTLSRNQMDRFWSITAKYNKDFHSESCNIPGEFTPVERFWSDY